MLYHSVKEVHQGSEQRVVLERQATVQLVQRLGLVRLRQVCRPAASQRCRKGSSSTTTNAISRSSRWSSGVIRTSDGGVQVVQLNGQQAVGQLAQEELDDAGRNVRCVLVVVERDLVP